MYFEPEDIYKIIVLVNAQNNGWKIGFLNSKTFYLIRNKEFKNGSSFRNEMDLLNKKPLNLSKVFNEIINKKNL